MAVSDDSPHDTLAEPVADYSRYDVLLSVVPVAFLLSGLASVLGSVSTRTAIVAAAVVGALVVLDALFVHPPTDD